MSIRTGITPRLSGKVRAKPARRELFGEKGIEGGSLGSPPLMEGQVEVPSDTSMSTPAADRAPLDLAAPLESPEPAEDTPVTQSGHFATDPSDPSSFLDEDTATPPIDPTEIDNLNGSGDGIDMSEFFDSDQEIGRVSDVSGSGCTFLFDKEALDAAQTEGELGLTQSGQLGSYLKVRIGDRWAFGVVSSLTRSDRSSDEGALSGVLDFVGEADTSADGTSISKFQRGLTKFPMPGQKLISATLTDLKTLFAPDGRAAVSIGTVHPTDIVRAAIFMDSMLSKHFAILGSTGSGKSCTTALVMHRLLAEAPFGHALILDPHNEYGAAFRERGVCFSVENLQLPYWMMNLEEHIEVFIGGRSEERELEVDILKRALAVARAKSRGTDPQKVNIDAPTPYLIGDLLSAIQKDMGKLEKPEKLVPFLRLRNKIEELKNDPRYSFMFGGLMVQDQLVDIISNIFRIPGDGKPISILDLSGVPSDIVDVVIALLARLAFDFAVWGRGRSSRPMLLVCEEAHRYVPEEGPGATRSAKKVLDRIAKEGRKYGVSLGLVSQRPADLSESVLSQCGTIISMRMNNERDRRFVESALPDAARGLLKVLPALRNRECIVSGEGVSAPVRVMLDHLPQEERPSSDDPSFSEVWGNSESSIKDVEDIIGAWRAQKR
ncbi:MAG: DUF87 domain-containing protein [Pseudomonadota bacterium]